VPILSSPELTELCSTIFQRAGVTEAEAKVVAESLVDSNLCGHDSHGVIRVPQYIQNLREGKLQANVPLTMIHETPAALAMDGNWGLGQVQAYRLLDRLLPKVQNLGIAIGTLRNCGHIGRLGEYAEWAASRQLALFGTVNAHGSGRRVTPPGGSQGRISTNPLVLGAPTHAEPLVLDIGTSVCAEGKVRVQFQKQQPTPEGWLVDSQGNPTTDPGVLYNEPRGAILPFGGDQNYKGFGLGLLLDVFAGGLSGGPCSNPDAQLAGIGNAVVLILISPAQLGGVDHFLNAATGLSEFVRSTPRAPGVDKITLPGDPERSNKAKRQASGIELTEVLWKQLQELAAM
jgi:hydroxycarboxylate dehydrogenase B